MSAVVKLSTKLPGDAETNGLDHFAHHLVEHPDEMLCVIGWVDASRVVHDTDSDAIVPTARIRRIEVLGTISEAPAVVRELVDMAVQKRLGRAPIPFELGKVEEGYDPDQTTFDEAD